MTAELHSSIPERLKERALSEEISRGILSGEFQFQKKVLEIGVPV